MSHKFLMMNHDLNHKMVPYTCGMVCWYMEHGAITVWAKWEKERRQPTTDRPVGYAAGKNASLSNSAFGSVARWGRDWILQNSPCFSLRFPPLFHRKLASRGRSSYCESSLCGQQRSESSEHIFNGMGTRISHGNEHQRGTGVKCWKQMGLWS